MASRDVLAMVLSVLSAFSATCSAGEFDRVEGDVIAGLIRGGDAKAHTTLTIGEMDALPTVLKDTRAALLLVKTSQGNYARLLAVPALRKPPQGDASPLPVLLLERFDTFEPGRSASRVARGSGMVLFDGFQVDLDAGIVVPEGQGGDLVFRAKDGAGPRIEPTGNASLYSVSKPIAVAETAGKPSRGAGVVASDATGRYTLYADGRWSGLLELIVSDDRQITGRFRSEPGGNSYSVRGEVASDPPNKLTFTIKFPRTEQEYEGFLWTEGKWGLAGTFTMIDRRFGFFAVREGAKLELGR
jgi:hypothetical protein